jgi:hypothetical protein
VGGALLLQRCTGVDEGSLHLLEPPSAPWRAMRSC